MRAGPLSARRLAIIAVLACGVASPGFSAGVGSSPGEDGGASEYASKIREAIRRNWNVPKRYRSTTLEVQIRLWVSDDGHLLSPAIRKSSGDATYDQLCLEAVRSTTKVPPPPPSLRAMYR